MARDSLDETIGKNIRQIRRDQRLSQRELAERLSISAQMVQKYEAGSSHISVDRLRQVADALKVTLPQLLYPVGSSDPIEQYLAPPMAAESRDLILHYYQLTPEMRETVLRHVKALAALR
ncbi:helix-turn-helix domain-containing protein [Oceanibacterium hippocampi]|uniref:Anaerobic benzoate catabolism transcriptional regulator n=1 Tax=Oceanibacterium hippocampi TaxID=745714 RepID=A0A1Y5RLE1_9PROT|nr:helix-turn-helix transcriptional regulator [Oceanibacterium hippocampi]SLN19246.1 anaerobic benzoate catabolism transcriptional regulator [Oceanibacterium hippocampi]